jgi:hypothetical protein
MKPATGAGEGAVGSTEAIMQNVPWNKVRLTVRSARRKRRNFGRSASGFGWSTERAASLFSISKLRGCDLVWTFAACASVTVAGILT